MNAGHFALATAYDRDWFFAANDLATLEALLDRADRRNPAATKNNLQESELFQAARKQLPHDSAAMFFIDPKPFVERLTPLLASAGPGSATRLQQLKMIRSFAGTIGFDHGKMREALFAAMPQMNPGEKIARPALERATKETFFYSASLANWPGNWSTSGANAAPALPAFFQGIAGTLTAAGVTGADVAAAFGHELEIVGDWPADAHWPRLAATLPVRDGARARKLLDALSAGALFGSTWTRSEASGVVTYSAPSIGGLVPINPTVALSQHMMVAGSDPAAVATLLSPSPAGNDSLTKSAAFHDAEERVPAGEIAFNYIDLPLLLERADATLRPLLLMSAALSPKLGQKLDAAQLPPVDVVVKHLSPIVMSQRYTGGGYLTESIGPVTFTEAVIGLASLGTAAYLHFQNGLGSVLAAPSPATVAAPTPAATPSATP